MATALGRIFDEDPELYARARQSYPPELVAVIDDLAGPLDGARVVEIGPGTGQATAGVLAAGARVTAVEPGAGLAGVLRRTCPVADVVVSPFEEWDGPAAAFDVVLAVTAWHWLEPEVRVARAARLLRPGGALVTVTTEHVAGGTTAFFADVQPRYEHWDPATEPGLRLHPADEIPPVTDEVDTSPRFAPAMRRRLEQDVTYTAEEYLLLLSSYSGHRALPAERRAGLFADIRALIDGRYGGTVTKRFLYEVRAARVLGGQLPR
jgi:SAM-dependent methyltransferase